MLLAVSSSVASKDESAMHLAYFFSKSAFNLLLIFISDFSVTDPSLE